MIILPLKAIHQIDKEVFGDNILNLSKLQHSGLPIPQGIAISAPEVKGDNLNSREDFLNQEILTLKTKLKKLPLSKDLTLELREKKELFFEEEIFGNKEKLWKEVLDSWIREFEEKAIRQGGLKEIHLSPKVILFPYSSKKYLKTLAYFDPHLKEVIIKNSSKTQEKIPPEVLKEINSLVLEANRKLYLPQNYNFLIGKKVEIVKVSPFTNSQEISKEDDFVITQAFSKPRTKSTVRIFLNALSQMCVDEVDGFLVEGEKITGFEETVIRLVDIASNHPDKSIIYKLADIVDGDVGGSLRLIYQKSLLDTLCAAFLFARNKRELLNLEIAIPRVKSVEEFLQIKRELASRGIVRKGLLKIWMEIAVPENILNLDKYIEAGIDGVILNLDSLQKLLVGFNPQEKEFYHHDVTALISLISLTCKLLHKHKIPLIVKGELVIHPEILDRLVSEGVWGIVVENVLEAEGLPEHLRWVERRIIIKVTLDPSKLPN